MVTKSGVVDYDFETFDVDDLQDVDVKINPSFYIHHCFVKLQNALIKDDAKAGFLQYRQLIEHLEIICLNTNLVIESSYREDFKNLLLDPDYVSWKSEFGDDSLKVLLKEGDFKLRLLMKAVFDNKSLVAPLEGVRRGGVKK